MEAELHHPGAPRAPGPELRGLLDAGTLAAAAGAVTSVAEAFLRPIGWRGKTPEARDLDGVLLFERDRRVTSFDGTEIAYTVRGRRGPWVALVPGLFCPDNFWRYLAPELARDHRVLIWDLRGLGASGTPREPGYRARGLTAEDFSVANLAGDLEAVLEDAGARKASLIGHSMGGQVILEAYRRTPKRVASLVFLTAPYESPVRTFYGRDLEGAVRTVDLMVRMLPRPAILAWRALLAGPPVVPHRAAQLARALGPAAKVEDMRTYYRHMAMLDPLVMLKMVQAMQEHSGADVLPTVEVPALIVAATLDTFTPIGLAERMRAAMPHAELTVVEGASHGAVIEKPAEINAAVRAFLEGLRASR